FYRDVAGRITQKVEADFFMDDNTWNILYFPHLLEMLPEAKLVHIYRDPRDVTASYMQQTWAPSSPIEAAKFYKGIMDRWEIVKKELPPDVYLEISLDKLVQDSESILHKVADFYGIPWDQSLLQIDLSKSHKDRWKKDIPKELQSEVQKILAEHITDFGYELG
ncbi:MAG TPA: sulfotransferase, partial [Balneolales bacterium]|nr:sulfotransferase [Balneolales bacterium]